MTWSETLVAYLATLAALIIVFMAALITGAIVPPVLMHIGDFALGTVLGGLLSALKTPPTRTSGSSEATTQSLVAKMPPTDDAPTDTGETK